MKTCQNSHPPTQVTQRATSLIRKRHYRYETAKFDRIPWAPYEGQTDERDTVGQQMSTCNKK